MYSDENKSSALAKYLNTFDYVLIDTCSLMEESFPEWMDILRGSKAYRKPTLEILIPRRCYDELKKHSRDRRSDSKRIDAKRALRVIWHARLRRLLQVTKLDKTENFADNAIYVKVSNDRLFARILVITQDKKLASDLRALNLLKSQSGKPLEVSKLTAGGRLVPNKGEDASFKEHKGPGAPFKQAPNNSSSAVSGDLEAILQADARLSAVVSNPNYPDEKKKSDAKAQLKAIDALTPTRKAQLHLLVPAEQLKAIVETGANKPVEKKTDSSPQKPVQEKPKKPEASVELDVAKPAAKRTLTASVKETAQKQEEPRKDEAENPKPAPKKTTKKVVKPASEEAEKPQEEPVKKTRAKKAKPAEEQPVSEPEASAEQPKPAKKKAAPKKQEQPAEEPKPEPDPFDVAKRADRRLRANLSNSNYDPKKKHRDIDRQLALIASLSEEQREELHFKPADLEQWKADNPIPEGDN
ncbi:MAG: hypothetical protein K6E59_07020 [Bacilli bacterium]|nr:hypothetical protein [Bacilli bacterium]